MINVSKDDLEMLFNMPSFYNMFIILNSKYDELNFRDKLSDSERIAEYTWITQQYRKYISRQHDVILSHDKLDDMLKEIEDMISKASEYGSNRKEIIYNSIRDEFLTNIYRIIEIWITDVDDEGSVE